MGNLLDHAKSSAEKLGGVPEDYYRIHEFIDSSKLFLPDWRHRALLHSTFGIFLAERYVFGPTYVRESDGVAVATRTIVEQHLLEDLNAILTPAEFLREMPLRIWMNGLSAAQRERLRYLALGQETEKDDPDAREKS